MLESIDFFNSLFEAGSQSADWFIFVHVCGCVYGGACGCCVGVYGY